MADSRSIPAHAAVAPVPTLTLNSGWDQRKDCCQSGHFARIHDLSATHAACHSVINSLCTKAVTKLTTV